MPNFCRVLRLDGIFPYFSKNLRAFVTDGWTKNDLIYIWKGEGALQFASNLSLPGGFKMANHTNKYCDVITATGAYSCLRVDLVFARELSFYIVTIYVPCFMIVVVSWFSFWLDYKAVCFTIFAFSSYFQKKLKAFCFRSKFEFA